MKKLNVTYLNPMTFRRKRSDTTIGTIEKKYNVDLGVRSDMQLGTYLRKNGLPSLAKLVERHKKRK